MNEKVYNELISIGYTPEQAKQRLSADIKPLAPTVGGALQAGVDRYTEGLGRMQDRANQTESVGEALLGGAAAPLTAIGSAAGAIGTTAFGLADVAFGGAISSTLAPVVQTVADINIGNDETVGSGISKLNQLTGGALEDAVDLSMLAIPEKIPTITPTDKELFNKELLDAYAYAYKL